MKRVFSLFFVLATFLLLFSANSRSVAQSSPRLVVFEAFMRPT